MKASEVIKRYKKGERDFQGENLRGANFCFTDEYLETIVINLLIINQVNYIKLD